MKNLSWLVSNAIREAHPEDVQKLLKGVSLDSAPFFGFFDAEDLDDATLEALITAYPSLVPRLVSTADSTPETMDRVIRMPHKPKAAIVNRVPMHATTKLSDYAVNYVLRNGGKKALETLLERHLHRLPVSVQLEVQRELFYRYKTLFYQSPHTTATLYSAPTTRRPANHRAFLLQSVSLLSEVTSKHVERPGFTPTVMEILNDASWAGFDTSESKVGSEGWTQPDAHELLDLILGRHGEDPYSVLMKATFHRGVSASMVFNKKLLDLIPDCTPEEQSLIYAACPSWAVLERVENPNAAIEGAPSFPAETEFHVPSYNLIRKFHIKQVTVSVHRAAVSVFMRLLVTELGDDEAKWATFQGLYDDWDQSVGELLETIESLH